MKDELITYLKKRPNALVFGLALVAVAGFCVLFFKPYRIYDWVQQYEILLFWAEIFLLSVIIVVLLKYISDQRTLISRLREQDSDIHETMPMYNFYDERGELKLSVKPEYLYFLEAADNYVQIHYQNMGKMQTLMIRNSLKNIEWRFKGTMLMRCHRSYLVNLQKVQVVKRVDGDVFLNFNDEQIISVPVGKAYADQIMTYFAK